MYSDSIDTDYHATTYCIDGPVPLRLRLDQYEPAISGWLAHHEFARVMIITAYNPGRLVDDAENAVRQAELVRAAESEATRWCHGRNLPDCESAPTEPSVVIPLSRPVEALTQARRWQQNAVVLIDHMATPQLIWG